MGKADGKGGVMRALVEEAAQQHAEIVAQAQGEQLDMLPVPTRHDGARRDAVVRLVAHNVAGGRPPGSGNVATKEFRDFLLRTGVSPLTQMMRYAMMTPTVLAAELSIDRAAAFAHLKDLWKELAPYLHQQMPRAVEIDQRSAGFLVLGTLSAAQRADLAQKTGVEFLELTAQEVPAAQSLSDSAGEKSQTDKSQIEDK